MATTPSQDSANTTNSANGRTNQRSARSGRSSFGKARDLQRGSARRKARLSDQEEAVVTGLLQAELEDKEEEQEQNQAQEAELQNIDPESSQIPISINRVSSQSGRPATRYELEGRRRQAELAAIQDRLPQGAKVQGDVLDQLGYNRRDDTDQPDDRPENQPQEPEEDRQEVGFNEPIGQPQARTSPTRRSNTRDQRTPGQELAERGKALGKNTAESAEKRAGQAVAGAVEKRIANQGAARFALARLSSSALGAFLTGGSSALLQAGLFAGSWLAKHWKQALAGVLILGFIGFVLLISLFGLANQTDAARDGTSPVQPVSIRSSVDISGLTAVLAGGKVTAESAQQVLDQITNLRSRFSDNSEALAALDAIEAAAKAIIADPSTAASQGAIIKENITKLKIANQANRQNIVLPNGGIKLAVPGVAEGGDDQCGIASIVMVLKYEIGDSYENSDYYDRANETTNKDAQPLQCVSPETLNKEIRRYGINKADWVGKRYNRVGGPDTILEYTKRSLLGGDPVVMFLGSDAIFAKTSHIVVVVGVLPGDNLDQDVYYINNPNVGPGNVEVGVDEVSPKGVREKLTGAYLKKFVSKGAYINSIYVRKGYTE